MSEKEGIVGRVVNGLNSALNIIGEGKIDNVDFIYGNGVRSSELENMQKLARNIAKAALKNRNETRLNKKSDEINDSVSFVFTPRPEKVVRMDRKRQQYKVPFAADYAIRSQSALQDSFLKFKYRIGDPYSLTSGVYSLETGKITSETSLVIEHEHPYFAVENVAGEYEIPQRGLINAVHSQLSRVRSASARQVIFDPTTKRY